MEAEKIKKYVQRRPNVTAAIVVFTKVYVERIFLIFLLPGVVRRGLFSTFITRGLPVIAQSEIFLLKGVSFYPSISPFTMKGCEGYACKNLMLTNGEEGKSLRIARRRKYFV